MIIAAVARGAQTGEWILEAAVMSGVLVVWQKVRTTIDREPIKLVGPVAHIVTVGLLLGYYLTPYYAPKPSVTSGGHSLSLAGHLWRVDAGGCGPRIPGL